MIARCIFHGTFLGSTSAWRHRVVPDRPWERHAVQVGCGRPRDARSTWEAAWRWPAGVGAGQRRQWVTAQAATWTGSRRQRMDDRQQLDSSRRCRPAPRRSPTTARRRPSPFRATRRSTRWSSPRRRPPTPSPSPTARRSPSTARSATAPRPCRTFAVNTGATLTIGDSADVLIGSLTNGTAGGGTVVIGPTIPAAYLTITPRHQHDLLRFVLGRGLAGTRQHLDDAHPHRRQQRRQHRHDRRRSHAVQLLRRRAHDRRRRAHRERPWPGRLRQRRHALGAEWRHAAGQRRSPGVERHGRLRTGLVGHGGRLHRSRHLRAGDAHHQQRRHRSTARAAPRSMRSSSRRASP